MALDWHAPEGYSLLPVCSFIQIWLIKALSTIDLDSQTESWPSTRPSIVHFHSKASVTTALWYSYFIYHGNLFSRTQSCLTTVVARHSLHCTKPLNMLPEESLY
jgi:hypothetical protein